MTEKMKEEKRSKPENETHENTESYCEECAGFGFAFVNDPCVGVQPCRCRKPDCTGVFLKLVDGHEGGDQTLLYFTSSESLTMFQQLISHIDVKDIPHAIPSKSPKIKETNSETKLAVVKTPASDMSTPENEN